MCIRATVTLSGDAGAMDLQPRKTTISGPRPGDVEGAETIALRVGALLEDNGAHSAVIEVEPPRRKMLWKGAAQHRSHTAAVDEARTHAEERLGRLFGNATSAGA